MDSRSMQVGPRRSPSGRMGPLDSRGLGAMRQASPPAQPRSQWDRPPSRSMRNQAKRPILQTGRMIERQSGRGRPSFHLSTGILLMTSASRAQGRANLTNSPRLHLPTAEIASSARWLINGFPATILVWTAEEWARLTDRPQDAQQYPNGTWCALRID